MEYELGLDSAAMANLFISSCKTVADNIILDCSGQRTDPFIPEALTGSDVVIVLLTPDLQGITWWQSVQSLLQELRASDKAIPVFSMIHSHHNENWLQEAIDLKNIVSIPFAPELNLLRSSGQTTDKPVTRAAANGKKA
jgi:Flp pilus assembly CpaE family ATPase